jgi:hypothetical protein
MRQFGLICVHDTQQPELYRDMLAAIGDATRNLKVSLTNLPFNCGLAIIRIEESRHPAVTPAFGKLPQGQSDTLPVAFASGAQQPLAVPMHRRWLVPIKIKIGHLLRQAGLKK